MKLLALDTSFSFLNATLIEGGKVTACFYEDRGKKTLEELPAVLKRMEVNPDEMDAFAVSTGVGYLTSLRIGITFTKTLAYLTKKPIFGFENLYIMGLFTQVEEPKVCLLRVSNNVFYRVFSGGKAGPVEVMKDSLPQGRKVGLKVQGLGELEFFPFSLYGGLWAYRRLEEGYEGDDPFLLEPLYLRPPL
ncbi:MAG: tRNA threonylcarbamoyladenosine biosynthesis protein TsaB, partial [Aquificaceae bacterium]|nr:tRNA threonylcarbamoyladenosine biosynthesis protein TsaB [Aquificaceae bacterium]